MSYKSSSQSPQRNRSHSRSKSSRKQNKSQSQDQVNNKLFITNIDGQVELTEIQSELRKLFEKYGEIESLVAKRNRNAEYCFAFVEMKSNTSARECAKNHNQTTLFGKKIRVEFQNDKKRRKDSEQQLIDSVKDVTTVEKKGILQENAGVRKLDDKRRERGYGRRDRSPSSSPEDRKRDKKSKRKHRDRSESSERERSYSRDKKHRKHREKSREREQRKKKSKRSSSYSR